MGEFSARQREPLTILLPLVAALIAIPLGLDLYMPVPEENPITVEKIELGQRLFSDRRLARDGSIACASCQRSGPLLSLANLERSLKATDCPSLLLRSSRGRARRRRSS